MAAGGMRAWRLEEVPLVSARALMALLLLALLVVAVFAPSARDLVEFLRTGDAPGDVSLTTTTVWLNIAFVLLLFVGVPFGYVSLVRPARPPHAVLGLGVTPRLAFHLLVGAVAGFLVVVVLSATLYSLSHLGWFEEEPSLLVDEIARLVREHPEYLLILPLASAVPEEILFRGLLLPRVGLVGSSLLFGLVHAGYGTVVQIAAPALLGLVFGLVYRRLGSLWAPIAAHFTFNLVELLAVFFFDAEGGPAIAFL